MKLKTLVNETVFNHCNTYLIGKKGTLVEAEQIAHMRWVIDDLKEANAHLKVSITDLFARGY